MFKKTTIYIYLFIQIITKGVFIKSRSVEKHVLGFRPIIVIRSKVKNNVPKCIFL